MSVESPCPIPPYGLYDFEKGFSKANLNGHLKREVEKIKSYIEKNPLMKEKGEGYILSLENRVIKNTFFLSKRFEKNKEFSASYCVQHNDINGLKLIVANEYEVNQADKQGFTALHLAAADPEKLEYLEVLLLHPNIDTKMRTIYGTTAFNLARREDGISC